MKRTKNLYGKTFFSRRDLVELLDDEHNRIPSAYELGMSPVVKTTTIRFAGQVLKQLNTSNIIDIGCGKGYLDRILENCFHAKVFCVDKNKERLKNTLKWNSLIRGNLEEQGTLILNGRKHGISGNICTMMKNVKNKSDLRGILLQASTFFRLGRPLNLHLQDITIVALKICGDFIYNFVDGLSEIRYSGLGHQLQHINFAIVPCCVGKSERFPASQKLRECTAEKRDDDVIMLDMYMYMVECEDIANVDVNYLNDGYYMFTGKICKEKSGNKGSEFGVQ